MTASLATVISLDSDIFRSYAFWTAVLVVKMLLMSILTGRQRFTKNVFANPEDIKGKKAKLGFDDPDVERVRRAHRNDLENILPFIAVGFLYLFTSPSAVIAINLFRAVGIARIVHTLVYAVFVVPQPSRALSWFVAYGVTFFMAVQTVLFFL